MKVAIGLLVFAVTSGIVAATTVVSPGRLSLEALTFTLFGLAAFWAYVFAAPRFVRKGKVVEDRTSWVKMVVSVFGFVLAAGFVMWGARDVHEAWESARGGPTPHSNSSHVIVFLCSLFLLTLLSAMLRSTRNVAMVIRVLAASPKGVAGRIEDGAPIESGPFFVVTDDGERVEIDPRSSTWASSTAAAGDVWVVDDEVGGRLFYATPKGTSARGRIRLFAFMRIGVTLLLLACIAGMVARASQLAPRLPEFDLGETAI